MRPITPVHLRATGPKVSNLHKGLLFLIMHESITDETRRTLQRQLAGDVQTQTFGSGTANLVSIYQEQLKNRHDIPKDIKNALPVNGDVGPATADALNWDLRSLGALPKPKPKPPNK